MGRNPTHYELLGVRRNASADQIRNAYRTAARTLHPDTGGDPAAMQRLNAAWHVLRDPGRRRAYDQTLGSHAPQARPMPETPAGDPPDRSEEWNDVYADLLDTTPIGPIRAPEGWWAVAPAGALLLGVGLALGAFVLGSAALLVLAGSTMFVAFGLFILAPMLAMTRPRPRR
ncbi:MAG TPA: J domain-containing protein [Acidimicrobiales bacterium]